jgi:hypothetical protein
MPKVHDRRLAGGCALAETIFIAHIARRAFIKMATRTLLLAHDSLIKSYREQAHYR